MAVDLEAIHRALATQISAYLVANGVNTNVNPFPVGILSPPQITVHSDPGGYLAYMGTFGPNGDADMMLRLKIEVDAIEGESVCMKMCDYLGVGTGNGSSVADAVMNDKTLGGTVENAVVLFAEWDTENTPYEAWIPVKIILKKQNAKV